MRGLYEARRNALVDAVAHHADGLLRIAAPACTKRAGGLHAVATLSRPVPTDAVLYRRALQHGLQTPPLSAYYAGTPSRSGLLLGFASTPEDRIGDAVRRLAALVEGAATAPRRRARSQANHGFRP